MLSIISFIFIFTNILPPSYAQSVPQALFNLPTPGTMFSLSNSYIPTLIKGIVVRPENPLQFDFIIDTGDSNLEGEAFKQEATRLIKYFFASLTVPEEEMWVNLSPYEKNKIIPRAFGLTEMGRDLLAQDYILKQLTASLIYPENGLGKEFWNRVYKKAQEKYGTTDIPINTFNKIWIVSDKAAVIEYNGTMLIKESRLKVLLEEDYLALQNNLNNERYGLDKVKEPDAKVVSGVSSQVVKEILIPEIEKEVNEGKNFVNLRQIYNSMVLAAWYKIRLKDSLLGKVYFNQNKVKGVDVEDKEIKQKIYEQYVEAFKKGVYDYIKEDYDPVSQEVILRKYFSGGFSPRNQLGELLSEQTRRESEVLPQGPGVSLTPDQRGDWIEAAQPTNPAQSHINLVSAVAAEMGPRSVETLEVERSMVRGSDSAMLTDTRLTLLFDERKLDQSSRDYWLTLLDRYNNPSQDRSKLVIKVDDSSPGNFKLSASMTQPEREEKLGVVEYRNVVEEMESEHRPYIYDTLLGVLDAGLGTNLERTSYIKKRWNRGFLGAKGTDLGFERIVPDRLVSVAEVKLLRLIKEIENEKFPTGREIVFQPIVNEDSQPSYKALLKQSYIMDLIEGKTEDQARTYAQVLDSLGVKVEMRLAPFYPALDKNTKEPTNAFKASGSHGEWGFKYFREALDITPTEIPRMIFFYNGDGTNNFPDQYISQWMVKHNIPIVMISTTKAGVDRKGGQIGIELLPESQFRIRMLELASTKGDKGQQKIFEEAGLPGGIGDSGKQYFNTNIAVINYSLMAKILQDLLKDVFNGKTEELFKILSPDLIASKKGDNENFIQLEGPIGTVFLNLHNYFVEKKDNPKVKAILDKYHVDKLLRIVNADASDRTQFFTPIKFAYEHWLQAQSDYYVLDKNTWTLKDRIHGKTPPTFNLLDSYYLDVENMIASFGKASVIDLDQVDIHGKVELKDAVLKGKVKIDNQSGRTVDLNKNKFKKLFNQTSDKRIILDNISITIDTAGKILWKKLEVQDHAMLSSNGEQLKNNPKTVVIDLPDRQLENVSREAERGDVAQALPEGLRVDLERRFGEDVDVEEAIVSPTPDSIVRTSRVVTSVQLGPQVTEVVKKYFPEIPAAPKPGDEAMLVDTKLAAVSPSEAVKILKPAQPVFPGSDKKGGIDLNPALLDLQIKRDGNGFPLPLPQQPIENMRIEGFLPIIINITPVTNMPFLLGISNPTIGQPTVADVVKDTLGFLPIPQKNRMKGLIEDSPKEVYKLGKLN